jgi:hypothetical protein
MATNGVSIYYGDIAPGAKENFSPSISDKEEFVVEDQLKKNGLYFRNYGNPCEMYSVVLDGSTQVFPPDPENKNMGIWSKQISNENGEFETPIVLTLSADQNFSSQGFTFIFDTYNNIYPTKINIHWWRDGEETTDLGEKDFVPDNPKYFAHNKVEYYNRVVITFYSLNMPKNRLKLRSIDYGYGTVFYGDELRNTKILQEIDPISSEISINTADFVLDSNRAGIEYSFQEKQPLSIYFNGKLKATTFVKKSRRKSKFLWEIKSEDYIGFLDRIPFYGGVYNNKNAGELFDEIFSKANVPYEIDDSIQNEFVSGHIPYTTCREALRQVAFATQRVVDTSNSDVVNVYTLDDSLKQQISLERIMQGQSFSEDEVVTSVELVEHSYVKKDDDVVVYSAEESGEGENIFIVFQEPVHSLTISNGSILESGENYSIINAEPQCVLMGKKYDHITTSKTKRNESVLAATIEKNVLINSATLISSLNVANVLDMCYNYITKKNSATMKIIEGVHERKSSDSIYGSSNYGVSKYKNAIVPLIDYYWDMPTNVSDNIMVETEYMGYLTGRIVKQTFNLNGGIIVKDSVVRW